MLNTELTTNELVEWLRIDDDVASTELGTLELILQSAHEQVELELGHDFDGEKPPELVRRSILKLATSDYERRQPGVQFETISVTQANYTDALDEIRRELWGYRRIVGF